MAIKPTETEGSDMTMHSGIRSDWAPSAYSLCAPGIGYGGAVITYGVMTGTLEDAVGFEPHANGFALFGALVSARAADRVADSLWRAMQEAQRKLASQRRGSRGYYAALSDCFYRVQLHQTAALLRHSAATAAETLAVNGEKLPSWYKNDCVRAVLNVTL